MEAALFLDAAVAFLKRYKALMVVLPLLTLLALSHCSDKRHTRQRDEARAENAAIIAASEANRREAIAQVKAQQAKFDEQAKETDRVHTQALADARGATARYIAVHSLRADKGGVCAAPAASESDGAGVSQDTTPQAGLVVTTTDNLTTCASDYAYALSAYEWAKGLGK